ncbi:hypothetical protein SmJEL517_g02886 [Synchytrium microbalum]|uniref:Uncharacterized protein n=1 Tax=Synchytrium microbalum TaxID=1806994 RepID=A0A507C5U2_9FUNG|nr:uncharacterized protein SmJEL517_g02886 [Synchytrium microbalum]TPX34469.1 hypothetical protein SmJEL517_g02886 [Synchytrium microbalum]
MEIVPFKYTNPFVNLKYEPTRIFYFGDTTIRIHQNVADRESISLHQNTGNVIWDGAYVLADYLDQHLDIKDLSTVELGAGCGLLSLLSLAKGAKTVVATDLPEHLDHIQLNVTENVKDSDHLSRIHVQSLAWGDAASGAALKVTQPDLIVASEILYLEDLHADLLRTLNALSTHSTRVLMSYKNRNMGEEKFFTRAKALRWNIEMVEARSLHKEFQTGEYRVFYMTRRSQS